MATPFPKGTAAASFEDMNSDANLALGCEELVLSYHNKETRTFAICTNYGDLIKFLNSNPAKCTGGFVLRIVSLCCAYAHHISLAVLVPTDISQSSF